jgi:hypothetical protein
VLPLLPLLQLLARHRHAELERHVEARQPFLSVLSAPRQIVARVRAPATRR